MKLFQTQILLLGTFAILGLTGCEFSLAQDITPPANYQRVSLESQATEEVFVLPENSPELASGAAIFAKSCEPCHGESGKGGGSQVANLPAEPPHIGSIELASQASPEEWFAIITRGNLEALMPPFENSLSVQERWDVLAYVYSLSDSLQLLNGILSEDMQIAEIIEAIDELEATEQTQESSENVIELGTISGQVTHGGNIQIPNNTEIKLLGLDGFDPKINKVSTIKPDGSFSFEDVELADQRIFFVSVDYQGMNYGSSFDIMPDNASILDLPVVIFETTQDASELIIDTLVLQIEFPTADLARLHYIYQVSNPTLQTVISADDNQPVLTYKLPPNAVNFAFEQQISADNFTITTDGFGDKRSILAGSNSYTLAFGYELPYSRGMSIDLDLAWPVEKLVVLLPLGNLKLNNDSIVKVNETQVSGEQYQVFSGDLFQPGTLTLEISGRNPNAQSGLFGFDLDIELLISISVFMVAITTAYLWFNRNRYRQRVHAATTANYIIDNIIAIEDQFEAGDLDQDAYQQQRYELKSQLGRLLQKSE